MARIPAVQAYALRVACHALRDRGSSVRAIAYELGLSIGSVQNYLASPAPSSSPGDAVDRALVLRQLPENRHRGPSEVRDLLRAEGYSSIPSVSTLAAAMRDAGLARKGEFRSSTRRPYHTEARPSRYLDQLQMDTVKLLVGGQIVEFLSVRDVYTGCHYLRRHNGTHKGMVAALAAIRGVFDGLPRVIQVDNGTTDFSLPRRSRLRPWHRYAFSHGVERVQFIPEAEPRRNGSVESFHDWLKDEWDNHGRAAGVDLLSLDAWIHDRLHYYNYSRTLGTTGRIPASLASDAGGAFLLSAPSAPLLYDAGAPGCISFVRYVSRSVDRDSGAVAAVAVVKAPACVFVVPHAFEGGYLRFDLHTDGRGEVWAPAPADVSRAMRSGEDRKGRRYADRGAPGLLVATFDSPLLVDSDQGLISVRPVLDAVAAGYDAVATDPAALVRQWRRVLKQKQPGLLPSGYRLVVGPDGMWEAWRDDDLVWTEESSPDVIEHAGEVY